MVAALAGRGGDEGPRVEVEPRASAVDAPVELTVTGLEPRARADAWLRVLEFLEAA